MFDIFSESIIDSLSLIFYHILFYSLISFLKLVQYETRQSRF